VTDDLTEQRRLRRRNIQQRVLIRLLLILVLLAGYTAWFAPARRTSAPREVEARDDLWPVERKTIELYRRASSSVVHITSIVQRRDFWSLNVYEIPQGTGTGFVWDKDGHVVTNYHVVEGAARLSVTLADTSNWPGKVVGVDPHKDLAVVKIDAPGRLLQPLALGQSEDLMVGQQVFAIGNPFGLDQTLSTGVISAIGREIESPARRPIQDVIQTDAAINPGNSGGPLLDSSGRLIGVNTAIYSPSGAYAGIGFAIPVDTVNRVVPQLVSYGRSIRPSLGMKLAPDHWNQRVGAKGILVVRVEPDTSAARAGVQGLRRDARGNLLIGDIITAIDGTEVTRYNDIYRILDRHRVGDKVTVTLLRDDEKREIEVELTAAE
jgi:S1-C subfamily serine protease